MPLRDFLTDQATFKQITDVTDGIGAVTKQEVDLYTDIPCKLNLISSGVNLPQSNQTQRKVEIEDSIKFYCIVQSNYDGAEKGYRVVINSKNFHVIRKIIAKGFTTSHVVYYLKEGD